MFRCTRRPLSSVVRQFGAAEPRLANAWERGRTWSEPSERLGAGPDMERTGQRWPVECVFPLTIRHLTPETGGRLRRMMPYGGELG
jgi:hypothetical protein